MQNSNFMGGLMVVRDKKMVHSKAGNVAIFKSSGAFKTGAPGVWVNRGICNDVECDLITENNKRTGTGGVAPVPLLFKRSAVAQSSSGYVNIILI